MANANAEEVFEILLNELNFALMEVREKAAKSLQQGNYDAAQKLLKKAQQVDAFVAELRAKRQEWLQIVRERFFVQPFPPSQSIGKTRRGLAGKELQMADVGQVDMEESRTGGSHSCTEGEEKSSQHATEANAHWGESTNDTFHCRTEVIGQQFRDSVADSTAQREKQQEIQSEDFSERFYEQCGTFIDGRASLEDAQQQFKRQYIEYVLKQTEGNRTQAAKLLCVQRTYLSRLIRELNIKRKSHQTIQTENHPVGLFEQTQAFINNGASLEDAQRQFKRQYIEYVLKQTEGNRTQAAELLCVQRTYLSRLIKDLKIKF